MLRKIFLSIMIFNICVFTRTQAQSLKPASELGEWGLTAAVFYTARKIDKMPIWTSLLFSKGTTDRAYAENTISSSTLYAVAGGAALGIGFLPNNDGWLQISHYRHGKGIIEALSATFLVTNVVKNVVGRKRPSFDNYPESERIDANKSFFSGHTSISFALATYSSLYVMDYIGNNDFSKTAKWFYLAGSHALAAYVGYTRVIDNRHFVSDVIAGGIVGSTIALLVYSYQNKILNQTDTGNVSLTVLPSHLSLIIHF